MSYELPIFAFGICYFLINTHWNILIYCRYMCNIYVSIVYTTTWHPVIYIGVATPTSTFAKISGFQNSLPSLYCFRARTFHKKWSFKSLSSPSPAHAVNCSVLEDSAQMSFQDYKTLHSLVRRSTEKEENNFYTCILHCNIYDFRFLLTQTQI